MLSPYFFIVGQSPPTARAQAEAIAVLGLEVVGAVGAVDDESVRVARDLTTALRSAAADGPYPLAPASPGGHELIDLKLMHRCPDERRECMATIGRALGASHLVYGQVQRKTQRSAPAGYHVNVWFLDVTSGRSATLTRDFVPTAETTGGLVTQQGRRLYERILAGAPPRDRGPVTDGVLISAANQAFWQLTGHKPGQRLDMSDPRDRAMSKTWLDLYDQIQGRRRRATDLARRVVNETVTPYVLVIEQPDGKLVHQTFERRGNLDVQYNWVVDQPQYYAYLAMFDFSQKREAPILDQFAISKRQQMAASGWYEQRFQ